MRPMGLMGRFGEVRSGISGPGVPGWPRRSASSFVWLLIPILLASSVILGPEASAAPRQFDLRVRVRILDAQQAIAISGPRGNLVRIAAKRGFIEVDGSKAGRVWHSTGSGPFRIEPLAATGGQSYAVRGSLTVYATPDGIAVINEISLESYVAGTLGAEMYSSWKVAALRAQAVASRTYVLYQMEQNRDQAFDVVSDVGHQRYLGLDGESESTRSAVSRTRGEILRYDGRPALAAFHSASGGNTASAEEVWGIPVPYLRSVAVDEEDDSPDTYWRVPVSSKNLELVLRELGHSTGQIQSAVVVSRSPSGRVTGIEFAGTRGRATVSGRELRQAIGLGVLKSTLFQIRDKLGEGSQNVIFIGSGHGHGVGMSQWAAQAMAEKGKSYREILQNFYPGTHLTPLTRDDLANLPAVSSALESAESERTGNAIN